MELSFPQFPPTIASKLSKKRVIVDEQDPDSATVPKRFRIVDTDVVVPLESWTIDELVAESKALDALAVQTAHTRLELLRFMYEHHGGIFQCTTTSCRRNLARADVYYRGWWGSEQWRSSIICAACYNTPRHLGEPYTSADASIYYTVNIRPSGGIVRLDFAQIPACHDFHAALTTCRPSRFKTQTITFYERELADTNVPLPHTGTTGYQGEIFVEFSK